LEAQKKKFRGGTRPLQEALLWALFTANSYKINLQFFLNDQVEELNFRKIFQILETLGLILEKNVWKSRLITINSGRSDVRRKLLVIVSYHFEKKAKSEPIRDAYSSTLLVDSKPRDTTCVPHRRLQEMYVYLNNCAVLCSTPYFCLIEYICWESKDIFK
jgi:hypothetical protein